MFPLQLPAPIRCSPGMQALPGLGLRWCPCRAPARLGLAPKAGGGARAAGTALLSSTASLMVHVSSLPRTHRPDPRALMGRRRVRHALAATGTVHGPGGWFPPFPLSPSPFTPKPLPTYTQPPALAPAKTASLERKKKKQQLVSGAHGAGGCSGWSRAPQHHFPQRLLCSGTSPGHRSLPPCASLPGHCWPQGKAALPFLRDPAACRGRRRLGSGVPPGVPTPYLLGCRGHYGTPASRLLPPAGAGALSAGKFGQDQDLLARGRAAALTLAPGCISPGCRSPNARLGEGEQSST